MFESVEAGLRALVGFARSLKVTFNDIEVGLDREPEPGLADNGDLETDLGVLLEQAGLAARQAGVESDSPGTSKRVCGGRRF